MTAGGFGLHVAVVEDEDAKSRRIVMLPVVNVIVPVFFAAQVPVVAGLVGTVTTTG